MSRNPALLDTDTLSEVIKGRNPSIQRYASEHLTRHQTFQFSIVTRYEILRGLKAKDAFRKEELFELRCLESVILPLSDEVVVKGAEIWAFLRRSWVMIDDGDILIAATALVHGLVLVTGNQDHFLRIPGLRCETWHSPLEGPM